VRAAPRELGAPRTGQAGDGDAGADLGSALRFLPAADLLFDQVLDRTHHLEPP
jgi:hypothetical protein